MIAAQVDQQKASGNTGHQVENLLGSLFIIVLLVLIFRSLTLALATIAPALFSVLISGPLVAEAAKHGLQVSPARAVPDDRAGARRWHGLRAVPGVPGPRGAARDAARRAGALCHGPVGPSRQPRPATSSIPGGRPGTLSPRSVTRVGESITFSAATVIAAVLTLLLASFSFYSDLGLPFAIALGVTLRRRADPAARRCCRIRLSLLAHEADALSSAFFGKPKLLPWSIQGTGQGRAPGAGSPAASSATRRQPW